jgi:hypothetical protein
MLQKSLRSFIAIENVLLPTMVRLCRVEERTFNVQRSMKLDLMSLTHVKLLQLYAYRCVALSGPTSSIVFQPPTCRLAVPRMSFRLGESV